MDSIKYSILDPTGNVTILVTSNVPVENQPQVAAFLLEQEIVAEQVGFLSKGTEECDITLRMAGGEFCGNATMSTAALYCEKKGITKGDIKVKVVGTPEPVVVTIDKEEGVYKGTLKMPKPLSIKEELLSFENHNYRYPIVNFVGISHVIIEDNMSIYMAENAIKLWCDKLKVNGLGFMILSEDKKTLRPLVYIKNPETMYWESSCASGTTAVGAYFSENLLKEINMDLEEPGGILNISVNHEGDLLLSGIVNISIIDKTLGVR